ncbi:hypothetical protein [Lysinibacillus sp. BSL11]
MEKINMNTPKDEAECILRQSAKKDIEKIHNLGLPIRTVDELGVYDLYPDGRKEYVKLYKKGIDDIE